MQRGGAGGSRTAVWAALEEGAGEQQQEAPMVGPRCALSPLGLLPGLFSETVVNSGRQGPGEAEGAICRGIAGE